jgi:hypothetical protein
MIKNVIFVSKLGIILSIAPMQLINQIKNHYYNIIYHYKY